MADNATPPVPTATDELVHGGATVHVQYIKIMDGTLDSTNKLAIDAQGAIMQRSEPLSTGTITSVTAAAASTTILASDPNRRRAVLVNDSTSIARVALGGTAASTTNYSYLMDPGGTVETDFDGAITAIWAAANGAMRVTAMS